MSVTNRFRRDFKLCTGAQFAKVFANGEKSVAKKLVIYRMRNHLGHARLGLAVGRKVGPAVVRNRIKRLLREAFRCARLPEHDYVIVARKGAATLTLTEAAEAFQGTHPVQARSAPNNPHTSPTRARRQQHQG